VLLDEELRVRNTWLAGQLVVEQGRITAALERALAQPYRYPKAAYHTVKLAPNPPLVFDAPSEPTTLNVIRVTPGIVTEHAQLRFEAERPFEQFMDEHALCYLTVLERHGHGGHAAHGVLQGFGLRRGAVASSVGHDAHNVVVAGDNEADMRLALDAVRAGGVCVVSQGTVRVRVALPIAGLMSDERVRVVAGETEALKAAWRAQGCTLPYMGFNLLPLSVIPELRLTDKGLVKVSTLERLPLFQP